METLRQFNNSYIKKKGKYWKNEQIIQEEIDTLKKRLNDLTFPSIVETFKPIADMLAERLKADGVQHCGPFGLSSENSFYWLRDKKKSITDKGNVLGSICFISYGGGWAIRNEGKETGSFQKGTVGEMNGMNSETVRIRPKMDIKWLLKWVRRGR